MPEPRLTDPPDKAARSATGSGAYPAGAPAGIGGLVRIGDPVRTGDPVLIDTDHGPARVHLFPAGTATGPATDAETSTGPGAGTSTSTGNGTRARGLLMLGHGAGGGVQAPDLRTTAAVALDLGWHVALVEQPYRVAGRRAPAPARQLDAAWTQVATHLTEGDTPHPPEGDGTEFAAFDVAGLPLVVGGRSSGARVACRTARHLGAVGVLCLAFPLHPPKDRPSRLPELDDAGLPVLVVQGEKDRFGMPPAAPGRTVAVVPGDHSLKKDQNTVGAAVRDWLSGLSPSSPGESGR